MTKTFIETIPVLPFGMLNAFLIVREQKAILVDTGLPNSEAAIEKKLNKHGLNWSDIQLIILTHAHIDHAGSAVALQALTHAPIVAHRLELPYCLGEAPKLLASGPFGRLFQMTGAIQKPFSYFTPDIIVESEEFSLRDYGFSADILHTPGHTPGSISVHFDDGQIVAGDLAASGVLLGGIIRRNRPKSPPFEEDHRTVAASLNQLLKRGGKTFYLGHGGPLNADQISKHVTNLGGN